jgi:hypothetical protein
LAGFSSGLSFKQLFLQRFCNRCRKQKSSGRKQIFFHKRLHALNFSLIGSSRPPLLDGGRAQIPDNLLDLRSRESGR